MELALDACGYIGTVAVFDGATVVASREVVMRGEAEERLMPAVVDAVMAAGGWDRLSAVWVGGGPGSFTPLRLAASIAKGVATARRLPLHAGSSLALAAADPGLGDGRVAVALDAMRGEVFVQLFERHGNSLGAPAPWQRVARDAAVELAQRAGARLLQLPVTGGEVRPHAAHFRLLHDAGLVMPVDLERWEPEYGRLAEAQVVWEARHGRPLSERP
ncbi:MAG: tRNA (adenosine(37)-N6)-threonylcarbamoyltransferase complex dimerization subunit type 1 TsaB [Gemmatimonadetes bacterium]|nr:tRNA (adenosine(37)-N6)-threonylcarbamoyltransferase complex dimerization subunit type 1 TsaB [Gemmatimonadota bacterium]